MTIIVRTEDRDLATELTKSSPPGIHPQIVRKGGKSFDPLAAQVFEIVIECIKDISNNVTAAVIYRWLLTTCARRSCTIHCNGKEIPKEEAALRGALEDGIEIGKDD